MSHVDFNQQFLDSLKRDAKRKKREDPSLSYNQWLDVLSSQYGFATYNSLKRRVGEIEQQVLDEAVAAEEAEWANRFKEPMVWGSVAGVSGIELGETYPLPVVEGSVPWPICFAGSSLFTCADGPRRHFHGPLFTMAGDPAMLFQGEELRVADDHTVLQALICSVGVYPCGRLVEFTKEDLDNAVGLPLPQWGIPLQYEAIARSLWRLAHCELSINQYGFSGPILSYADARQAPNIFAVRFNPAFANFFYPVLQLFS
jgi:hypothetical protein